MIDQHMILGEFQHRQALIRVHNAICCLAERFDLIMWEGGVGVSGSLDMYTTFGHLIFEEEGDGQSDRGRRIGKDEIKPGSVSFESISEGIAWLHDVDTMALESDRRHLPVMSIISRNEWLYADELDSSRREGGSIWWIEARARSTFVPPPSPPIPVHVDHDDSVIADIMRRLETGGLLRLTMLKQTRMKKKKNWSGTSLRVRRQTLTKADCQNASILPPVHHSLNLIPPNLSVEREV